MVLESGEGQELQIFQRDAEVAHSPRLSPYVDWLEGDYQPLEEEGIAGPLNFEEFGLIALLCSFSPL